MEDLKDNEKKNVLSPWFKDYKKRGDGPVVLVVDDYPRNLQLLSRTIENAGYETVLALNGKQALQYVEQEKPDIILLDITMPEMDGYEVCKRLKESEETSDIPVIFLTANNETKDVVMGFELGAVDYIVKPFRAKELIARLRNHLEIKYYHDALQEVNKELQETNFKLEKANELINFKNTQLKEIMEQLATAASTDALTGLGNRRSAIERFEEEIKRYKRNRKTFSVLMADIDFFKKINDAYGHDCGDYILKEVAYLLQNNIREQDLVARWGGEEFLFILTETNSEGAHILAEKLRVKIADAKFTYEGKEVPVTMTFGVAEFDDEMTVDLTIKKADDALYQGKNMGRNCVV